MAALLFVHISSATFGLLSGAVAMTARKGGRWHALAGNVFMAAIVTMGLTGALVAVVRWLGAAHAYQVGNLLMGLFTAYLAATGWWTGRRRAKGVGWQDYVVLAAGAVVMALFVAAGIGTAAGALWLQHGNGALFFFVVGSLAALAVVGDLRLLLNRGVIGPARLRRHLWRMCLAMLITVLSFFIGQSQVLPLWLVRMKVNLVPVLAALVYLLFWLVKMRARSGLLRFQATAARAKLSW